MAVDQLEAMMQTIEFGLSSPKGSHGCRSIESGNILWGRGVSVPRRAATAGELYALLYIQFIFAVSVPRRVAMAVESPLEFNPFNEFCLSSPKGSHGYRHT